MLHTPFSFSVSTPFSFSAKKMESSKYQHSRPASFNVHMESGADKTEQHARVHMARPGRRLTGRANLGAHSAVAEGRRQLHWNRLPLLRAVSGRLAIESYELCFGATRRSKKRLKTTKLFCCGTYSARW